MHYSIYNLNLIKEEINNLKIKNDNKIVFPEIIAVSKTVEVENIKPLIDHGHIHFGENKVQEALDKWFNFKNQYKKIKLHMLGKLQSNKVKFAVKIFDFIHSVDNEKLAKKILDEQNKFKKNIKIFLQVNIGNENQKSGIHKDNLNQLVSYCKRINLNVIGLMCIPPANNDPESYFQEMKELNKSLGFSDLSMGMSSDFLLATKYSSTYIRVGSKIFGQRN